jgi:phosphoribosylcarboxyaminoimidazole (NCAIR) mutase
LAIRILAVSDAELATQLDAFTLKQKDRVQQKDAALQERLKA